MSRTIFQRAAKSILARLGSDALLRGEVVAPARRAHVEHGVHVTDNDATYVRSVSTTLKGDNARNGDTLVFVDEQGIAVAGESYVIEKVLEDNGFTVRHIVRRG